MPRHRSLTLKKFVAAIDPELMERYFTEKVSQNAELPQRFVMSPKAFEVFMDDHRNAEANGQTRFQSQSPGVVMVLTLHWGFQMQEPSMRGLHSAARQLALVPLTWTCLVSQTSHPANTRFASRPKTMIVPPQIRT